jgi:trans-2,3-dihydro-3-hydroxyanthranilate isomerase
MQYEFFTADAFSEHRFHGAQIAVFPSAEGLDETQMQTLASELNLSETVFVLPVEGDPLRRRLHIFSPRRQIDFAGHPILATGAVLANTGAIEIGAEPIHMVFEQNTGPIDVYIEKRPNGPVFVQFSVQVKPITDHFVPRREEIAEFLGLEAAELEHSRFRPMMVACDRPYLVVPVRSHEAVRRASFNYPAWNHSSAPTILADEVLIFASASADPKNDFHGRLVGPAVASNEDPPIGSAMPAFGAYLCAHEHIAKGTHSFTIERGTPETRLSVLHVEMDHRGNAELDLRVGGPAVLVSEGRIFAPE